MSNYLANDLQDEARFHLITELGHDDVVDFTGEYYWRRRTWLVLSHYLLSLAPALAWVIVGILENAGFVRWLSVFGASVLAFIVLVPLHEGIHGAVYRIFGARDLRFSVSLKGFYAYAIAHRFVASRSELVWVAITPFIILNSLLVVAIIAFTPYQFFLLGVLLFHVAGTSGDWAILNFYWLNRDKEIYTYDDAVEQKSYFYEKIARFS